MAWIKDTSCSTLLWYKLSLLKVRCLTLLGFSWSIIEVCWVAWKKNLSLSCPIFLFCVPHPSRVEPKPWKGQDSRHLQRLGGSLVLTLSVSPVLSLLDISWLELFLACLLSCLESGSLLSFCWVSVSPFHSLSIFFFISKNSRDFLQSYCIWGPYEAAYLQVALMSTLLTPSSSPTNLALPPLGSLIASVAISGDFFISHLTWHLAACEIIYIPLQVALSWFPFFSWASFSLFENSFLLNIPGLLLCC